MRAQVEPYDESWPAIVPNAISPYAEAPTFEQVLQVFALMGVCRKANDGFFYNESGLRVVIRWLDDNQITENHIFKDERTK